jgi:hypothetical protein
LDGWRGDRADQGDTADGGHQQADPVGREALAAGDDYEREDQSVPGEVARREQKSARA